MPPVDNRMVYAYCSTPCMRAYYGVYYRCHLHSIAYGTHTPSSYTHGFHTLQGNPTKMAYTVGACRPLRHALGLSGSELCTHIGISVTKLHQRGVTTFTQVSVGLVYCVLQAFLIPMACLCVLPVLLVLPATTSSLVPPVLDLHKGL